MRIEMLCGRRALEYTNQLKEQNRRISQLLSENGMTLQIQWKNYRKNISS